MKKNFPYYPIYLDIEERSVLIIGGGEVCARKAETMLKYGGRVTIVSPEFTDEIERWAADGKMTLRRKLPVNVVDVTHLCEFIVPAIIESGSIQIAISTGGKSPALARTLKEDLKRAIGDEYAEVNDVLGTLRPGAKQTLPTDVDRKRFFDGIIAGGILEMLRSGRRAEAYETIARACEAAGVPLSDRVRQELARSSPSGS